MAQATQPKQDFATRLSQETLAQLDALVRAGRYKTRTAAIEEAVRRLALEQDGDLERRRRALDATRGAIKIRSTRESYYAAELDRLEFEAERVTGRSIRPK